MAGEADWTTPDQRQETDVTSSPPDAALPDVASLVLRSLTLIVISVLALVGNCLVLVVVLRFRKLRTPTNVFVCNLSLACFVIGAETLVMSGNVIENRNVLGDAGCRTWGMVAMISYVVVMLSFALISLSRYVLVNHSECSKKVFSVPSCVLGAVCTWLFALLLTIGAVAGWTEIEFNPRSKACSYSRRTGASFHYLVLSVSFGAPLIVGLVSYALLYITVRRSAHRCSPVPTNVQPTGSPATTTTAAVSRDQRLAASRRKAWKLSRMLMCTFAVYLACSGPYAVVNIIDAQGHLSDVVHVCVSWLLFSNAAINPLLYGLMNATFREAYLALCGRHRRTQPNTNAKALI